MASGTVKVLPSPGFLSRGSACGVGVVGVGVVGDVKLAGWTGALAVVGDVISLTDPSDLRLDGGIFNLPSSSISASCYKTRLQYCHSQSILHTHTSKIVAPSLVVVLLEPVNMA